MTEEGKRKAVELVRATFTSGKSWEETFSAVALFCEGLGAEIRKMQTPEQFMEMLDAEPVTKREEWVFLAALRFAPAIVRRGTSKLAKVAAQELPTPPGGQRRAFSAMEEQAICNYVSELHRNGLPLAIAQERAADKFDRSPRTIERVWQRRADPDSRTPGFEDAWRFITTDEGAGDHGLTAPTGEAARQGADAKNPDS